MAVKTSNGSSPPTSEQGVMNEFASGIPGWQSFAGDVLEKTKAFQWPNTPTTVAEMRNDAQLTGLFRATTLPIRRMRWHLNPNGAPEEITAQLARDYGLPLKGQYDENKPRTRNRFTFAKHLQHALLSLLFGHYVFEQAGEVRDDLKWHMTRAEARPPETIAYFDIAPNGELRGIKQNVVAWQPGSGTPMLAPQIDADRLVVYSWDKEGANWMGRSMLRSCYKPYTLKDRVLRVGAINIERAGGVPYINAPQGASGPEIERLDQMARRFRVGDRSGGALPFGAELKLAKAAGGDDAVNYVKLQNEEMGRSWLAMFMNLGQTHSGSRALGSAMIDYFAEAMGAVTDFIIVTFNEMIEQHVDWNWEGQDFCPLLDVDQVETERMSIADLVAAIDAGIIQVDDELESFIRESYQLPDKGKNPRPTPTGPAPSTPEPPAPVEASTRRTRSVRVVGATSPVNLPDRPLRREPTAIEAASGVDFGAMDAEWHDMRDQLVEDVQGVQEGQVTELTAAVRGAKGDLKKLSEIEATPAAHDIILAAMTKAAEKGIAQHVAEAKAQGKTITPPKISDIKTNLDIRATAVDNILASSISQSARNNAVRLSGGGLDTTEVADKVEELLSGLSDAYLRDRLGGAVSAAMNAGRNSTIKAGAPTRIYSSELLDTNTCPACIDVDGTEYDNMDDASADYPTGGYLECYGADRCRGSLIAVYGEVS